MKPYTCILILGSLLFLFSCDKVELTPRKSLECPSIGLGEKHGQDSVFQEILERYVSRGFPGLSAAIYTADEGLWTGAAGLANIEEGLAMGTCNVLFSGSVAKLYTVTAAMVLYEQGKLDLDAPIAPYLPEEVAQRLPNADRATIRQLMNHQAGMPDHDDDRELGKYIERNNGRLPDAMGQLAYLYDDKARFEPGDSAAYSSAHTVALALVIDQIAGEHHSHVISREIIQRLGLTETFYKNESGYPKPNNLVRGYWGKAKKNDDITEGAINYAEGSQGDAGIIATAHDYYHFLKALMEGKIVTQTTLEEMIDARYIYDDGTYALGFGLGLFFIKYKGEVVKVGHGGMTAGGMVHLYYYPSTQSYISIATNTLIEDDAGMLRSWGAGILVKTGEESLMDELEVVILEK